MPPGAGSRPRPGGAAETRKERVDRELIELLNELRVGLPGVQVIFGFLLTVPFAQRFAGIDGDQRSAYLATLIMLTLASLLLIAPAAQHRVLFRQQDKEQLLERSNRYALAGLVVLLAALALAVFFVLHAVVRGAAAASLSAAAILPGVWWWIALPLGRRRTAAQDAVPRS